MSVTGTVNCTATVTDWCGLLGYLNQEDHSGMDLCSDGRNGNSYRIVMVKSVSGHLEYRNENDRKIFILVDY
jgi:hypothetical protein